MASKRRLKISLKKKAVSLKDILIPLKSLDGYLISAIFDLQGNIIISHNNQSEKSGLSTISNLAVIKRITNALLNPGLSEECSFIQLNAEKVIFEALKVEQGQYIIATLLTVNANTSLAKLALQKIDQSFV